MCSELGAPCRPQPCHYDPALRLRVSASPPCEPVLCAMAVMQDVQVVRLPLPEGVIDETRALAERAARQPR